MPSAPLGAAPQRWWRLVPVAALLTFALILRAPITVIPPLLGELRADLALSPALAGLLTSVPVLCFGLLTPAASRLIRTVGINHGALYCLAAVILGSVIRSSSGTVAAFVGTACIGIGITIGNLVVPMLIGRQFRHRIELLTGAYSATVNVASTAATALAVPVAATIGWRWTTAGIGVFLGAIALLGWLIAYPPGADGVRSSIRRRAGLPEPVPILGRPLDESAATPQRRLILLVTIAFCGHTLAYYAATAWLPSALADMLAITATQAGLGAGVFQAAGIVGPMLVPVLAAARCSQQRIMVIVGVAWLSLPSGMLLGPQLWILWTVIGGLAQGAFFTALVTVVIRRSRSLDENRRMTSTMQTVGYAVAATGPVLAGWAHQTLTGWSAPFGLILAALVVMLAASVLAVRTPQVR